LSQSRTTILEKVIELNNYIHKRFKYLFICWCKKPKCKKVCILK